MAEPRTPEVTLSPIALAASARVTTEHELKLAVAALAVPAKVVEAASNTAETAGIMILLKPGRVFI